MVTHIFKDGTTKEELKDVKVPKEIVEQVVAISKRKDSNEKKK